MQTPTGDVTTRGGWGLFPRGLASVALLVAGIYCILRGVGYLPALSGGVEVLPSGLELLANVIPIGGWGAAWLVIGLISCVRSLSRDDSVAWGAIVGIMMIWGLGYSFGWIMSLAEGEPNREWLSMTSYLGPALIIALLTTRPRKWG